MPFGMKDMTLRLRWWQWAAWSAVLIAACLAVWIRYERRTGTPPHHHAIDTLHGNGSDAEKNAF
jgi:hypothetical protein